MTSIPTRPTVERLQHLFYVDPQGVLRWRNASHPCSRFDLIGRVAGQTDCLGFRVVEIDRVKWPHDAVTFAIERGHWPENGEHHALPR